MPSKNPTQTTATTGKPSKIGKPAVVEKEHRSKTSRIPGAANLSGRLEDMLHVHAFERCRHFFLFLYTIKAIEYLNNKDTSRAPILAANGFDIKAMHQIDDGFRSEDPGHVDFRRDDDTVIDETATSFTNTDAAHFCNLGIKPSFTGQLDLSNQHVFDLHEQLKVFAGNTTWLPQIVNIGPDRKIDVLHGELATKFLKDTTSAVCSRSRIAEYINEATLRLTNYALQQRKAKNHGKAACALCYVTAYAKITTQQFGHITKTDPNFAERVFSSMSGSIAGWCGATFNEQDERLRVEQMLIAYT